MQIRRLAKCLHQTGQHSFTCCFILRLPANPGCHIIPLILFSHKRYRQCDLVIHRFALPDQIIVVKLFLPPAFPRHLRVRSFRYQKRSSIHFHKTPHGRLVCQKIASDLLQPDLALILCRVLHKPPDIFHHGINPVAGDVHSTNFVRCRRYPADINTGKHKLFSIVCLRIQRIVHLPPAGPIFLPARCAGFYKPQRVVPLKRINLRKAAHEFCNLLIQIASVDQLSCGINAGIKSRAVILDRIDRSQFMPPLPFSFTKEFRGRLRLAETP